MSSLDSKVTSDCDLRCESLQYKRLTPCLPCSPPLKDRCSSLVVDKCSSRLSCGSLSPIAPEQRLSRYKYGVNDVRIIVSDSQNNNSVFLNNEDLETAEEGGARTQKFYTALESSVVSRNGQSSNKILSSSTNPSKVAVILVWASLSSAVFGTFIGLAVAFTSLSVGAGLAGACVMVIVAVMVISHRIFRQQGSGGRRRASYTRLEGSDCACSPSMTNIFYQCQHEAGPRRVSASYQSVYQ